MSSNEIAIRVANLSKCYQIYDAPRDRLKQFILPSLQRFAGKQSKQYFREFFALQDVSFDVKKGETVGIIGRNGSGKSTLLQMICGTLNPTSGTIQTNGRVAALLELGSGFNPEFTGHENVYMNASVLGLSNEEIDARFDDIAAFADIGQFIEQPVKIYSSGMMVRLAFAVAINVEPQILVVDEALSVGDELFQRKCFSRIEAIKKNGATILLVSHSGATVIELCDRALLLDSGERLDMGSPKVIVGKYQKLIYSPPEKCAEIREKIRASNAVRKNAESVQIAQAVQDSLDNMQATENEPEDFFDPTLKPQSILAYESAGAFIESPDILTLSSEKVNFLRRGKTYRYTYKVRFDKSAINVRFGMLVKTISGLELGGAVSAPGVGQGIPYVPSGTIAIVEFRFNCHLNPGTYFLNAGVMGSNHGIETYLHRVLDICMFKVMPYTGNTSTAIIDFNCANEIELINSSLQEESSL